MIAVIMEYFWYVPPFISILIVVVVFIDSRVENKADEAKKVTMWRIAHVSLSILIIPLLVFQQKFQDNKRAHEEAEWEVKINQQIKKTEEARKSEKIYREGAKIYREDAKIERDALIKKIVDLQSLVENLKAELSKNGRKQVELLEEQRNFQTGGDSAPIFSFGYKSSGDVEFINNVEGRHVLAISVNGKYPLHNLSWVIEDAHQTGSYPKPISGEVAILRPGQTKEIAFPYRGSMISNTMCINATVKANNDQWAYRKCSAPDLRFIERDLDKSLWMLEKSSLGLTSQEMNLDELIKKLVEDKRYRQE